MLEEPCRPRGVLSKDIHAGKISKTLRRLGGSKKCTELEVVIDVRVGGSSSMSASAAIAKSFTIVATSAHTRPRFQRIVVSYIKRREHRGCNNFTGSSKIVS